MKHIKQDKRQKGKDKGEVFGRKSEDKKYLI
jgi:hypothetical protein